jgi:hypothetical protein
MTGMKPEPLFCNLLRIEIFLHATIDTPGAHAGPYRVFGDPHGLTDSQPGNTLTIVGTTETECPARVPEVERAGREEVEAKEFSVRQTPATLDCRHRE